MTRPELTAADRSACVETERLALRPASRNDLEALFAIQSDPRQWHHYPSLRRTDPARTLTDIDRWRAGWSSDGLGTWTVRLRPDAHVIGYGGCSRQGDAWNLGYRIAAEAQGHGYATELSVAAMREARAVAPDRPIIAALLEHNRASQRTALKLGMELVCRTRDDGNPDPTAIRLLYADRVMSRAQLTSFLR